MSRYTGTHCKIQKTGETFTVYVMFLYLLWVHSVCVGPSFSSLTLQEAREPSGRCFRMPGEPILVIDINNAKPLGVSHSPLKVVQE
jgi:hypothetical protein